MNCNRLDCYLGAAPGDSQPQVLASAAPSRALWFAIGVMAAVAYFEWTKASPVIYSRLKK